MRIAHIHYGKDEIPVNADKFVMALIKGESDQMRLELIFEGNVVMVLTAKTADPLEELRNVRNDIIQKLRSAK